MEDILPVLILVLLLSGIPHLKSEIGVMVDFLGFDPCDLEAERRLLVNLSVPLPARRSPTITFAATGKSPSDISCPI